MLSVGSLLPAAVAVRRAGPSAAARAPRRATRSGANSHTVVTFGDCVTNKVVAVRVEHARMARLLPSLGDTTAADDPAPRVIGLDSADADDLLGVLSSRTARRILATLHEEPASASEVAEGVDTSLQNVQYHLGRMHDAGLVEVVDTVYSEKGREMKLYAPADRPLVVVAGDDSDTDGLRSALTRLLGAVGVLALVSALVQFLLGRTTTTAGTATSADSAEASRIAAETTAAAATTGLPPGLVFFCGGLAVLVAWFAVRALRARRAGE
jgi:DNA-binding transcriptional ArsR family regulator